LWELRLRLAKSPVDPYAGQLLDFAAKMRDRPAGYPILALRRHLHEVACRMSTDSVAMLLAKLSTGDTAAAERIFLSYEPYLRKIVRRKLSAKLRAKFDSIDVVQSVWADLLQDLSAGELQFKDANHLRAFLIRVIQNRFHDHLRKHHIESKREMPFAAIEATDRAASHQPSPSEFMQAQDLWEQMLALCPPPHQELLRLKREGLPLPEIAARTGLHPGSIRRILRDLARKLALMKRPIGSNDQS
jgi:RNA polymerase sigma-70 factor (ECF subfamily)